MNLLVCRYTLAPVGSFWARSRITSHLGTWDYFRRARAAIDAIDAIYIYIYQILIGPLPRGPSRLLSHDRALSRRHGRRGRHRHREVLARADAWRDVHLDILAVVLGRHECTGRRLRGSGIETMPRRWRVPAQSRCQVKNQRRSLGRRDARRREP